MFPFLLNPDHLNRLLSPPEALKEFGHRRRALESSFLSSVSRARRDAAIERGRRGRELQDQLSRMTKDGFGRRD